MKTDHPEGREKRYVSLGLIGSGEMAEVHRCRMSGPRGFEKIVALKKLLPQWAKDPSAVADFCDEARLTALLSHENIVQVLDFGETDGGCYMVLEYLSGQNLEVVMQRSRPVPGGMSAACALAIAAGICAGMEHAHTARDLRQRPLNLVHRELSPDNIFITDEGKVKVLDFGCARADFLDDRMRMGMTKGKIAYMAPEQLAATGIDQRADIFAIGILLYEMLSGRCMYGGEPAMVIAKCRTAEFARLGSVAKGLSPAIYAIVDRALKPDPGMRYPSCGQMLADIEACLAAIQPRPDRHLPGRLLRRLFGGDEVPEERKRPVLAAPPEPELEAEEKKAALPVEAATLTAVPPSGRFRRFRPSLYFAAGSLAVILLIFLLSSEIGKEEKMEDKTASAFAPPPQAAVESLPAPVSEMPPAAEPPRQAGAVPAVFSEQPAKPPELPPKRVPSPDSGRAKKIEEFLAQAAEAWQEKRLTEPDRNCAFWFYSRILALDPKNAEAWQGIDRIGKFYAEQAEEATNDRRFEEAERYVQRGLQVFPDNRRLLALLEGMEERKRLYIRDLANKAERALKSDDLTTPVEACAYTYYKKILKLDKRNDAALDGLDRIADRYAELAEDAYRNLQLANCREFVRSGLSVAPHHPKLLELQGDLGRSMPGIFFKSIEKSISSMFE